MIAGAGPGTLNPYAIGAIPGIGIYIGISGHGFRDPGEFDEPFGVV